MNDMTGESFEEQPFISRLGLCSNTPQVLMSPPDLSGSSTVCFPLRRGDRLGQGVTAESIFSTWKLGMEGRETQDWFYPLPGNYKASGRPHCQGEGQSKRDCVTKSEQNESD